MATEVQIIAALARRLEWAQCDGESQGRPECVYTRVRVGAAEAHHNGVAWTGLYVRGERGCVIDPADVAKLAELMAAADGVGA